MNVSSTLTSLRYDDVPRVADEKRRLAAEAIPCGRLTSRERDEMYALLCVYFAGTERPRFDADLDEKDTVLLLRDSSSGHVQGFSTLMRMNADVDGESIVAFFSGDTIIDRSYWGETILSRIWAQVVFGAVDALARECPGTRAYWFLICSGYKTWRFLPLFFRQFYPHADGPTPPGSQRILDTLGARKFGDQYIAGSGIVRFHSATPLRHGVAELTDQRLRDPHVAFFARVNPGHADGDELACLAELSKSNLTRAGLRMTARPVDG
jgi:hypothetical protein